MMFPRVRCLTLGAKSPELCSTLLSAFLSFPKNDHALSRLCRRPSCMKLLFRNHHFKTALQISDRELCFRPRAPRMSALRMPAELHYLDLINLEYLLEFPPQPHQHFSRLLRRSAFATSDVPFTSTRHALAYSLRPQSDTIESLADIDHHAHDFAVVVGRLERLSDRS